MNNTLIANVAMDEAFGGKLNPKILPKLEKMPIGYCTKI